MRKRPTLIASLAVAAAAVTASIAVAGPPITGSNGNTQSVDVKIGPKKLSKTQSTLATLEVTTKLRNATKANGVPVPATGVIVDFDKTATLFTKGIPTCNAALLQNQSTAVAEEKCGRAKIGEGKATALLPVGPNVFTISQKVTAFNGVPKGGKPTVVLHTYGTTPIQTTLVLTGTVSSYNKQGYGPRLDVTIPPIAGGAGALTDFNVKINKKYKYKGVQRSFISAKCPNSKKLKARGAFKFSDGEVITVYSTQSCQQKK